MPSGRITFRQVLQPPNLDEDDAPSTSGSLFVRQGRPVLQPPNLINKSALSATGLRFVDQEQPNLYSDEPVLEMMERAKRSEWAEGSVSSSTPPQVDRYQSESGAALQRRIQQSQQVMRDYRRSIMTGLLDGTGDRPSPSQQQQGQRSGSAGSQKQGQEELKSFAINKRSLRDRAMLSDSWQSLVEGSSLVENFQSLLL